MNILEQIADRTRLRIAEEKKRLPLSALRREAEEQAARKPVSLSLENAFRRPGFHFLCEVKKASPSKGVIAEDFPYLSIARAYQDAGAEGISCLTEPFWFQGQDRYLQEIAREVSVPVLRKDFTVEEYMIYQAGILGASAVLLICAILDDGQLSAYRQLAQELGMDALVEVHDQKEAERALRSGATLMGVNNRDLRTFRVDLENTFRIRQSIPPEITLLSESGVRTPEEIKRLRKAGVNGVLIGETLMRAADKGAMLTWLRGGDAADAAEDSAFIQKSSDGETERRGGSPL